MYSIQDIEKEILFVEKGYGITKETFYTKFHSEVDQAEHNYKVASELYILFRATLD